MTIIDNKNADALVKIISRKSGKIDYYIDNVKCICAYKQYENSAIMYAVKRDWPWGVQKLIEANAEIDQQNHVLKAS